MSRNESMKWSKDTIKEVVRLWENHNIDEIANELHTHKWAIIRIAGLLRKEGLPIPKKTQKGHLNQLIKEVVSELR